MKTMTPARLIDIAQGHETLTVLKRAKAHKLDDRRFALQAQIAELTRKVADLNSEANGLLAAAGEHEAAAADLLQEARLAYTKGMDGPSEERAASWNTFLTTTTA